MNILCTLPSLLKNLSINQDGSEELFYSNWMILARWLVEYRKWKWTDGAVFSQVFSRVRFSEKIQCYWTSKTVNVIVKKLMNWFPWSVLLSTIERTSECSKRLVSVNHTTAARGCEHFNLQSGIWPDRNANKISQAVGHSGNDQYIKNFLEVICQKNQILGMSLP